MLDTGKAPHGIGEMPDRQVVGFDNAPTLESMIIQNARATVGLVTKAIPTSTNISGNVQIGQNADTLSFASADVAYSLQAFFAGASNTLSLNPFTASTAGSTAWVAGAAQIETATAAGTITASGNASVTVTAAGMTGSPKLISVAVLNTDTASQWADKVRVALAADTAVSALFAVSGSGTSIILTRKGTLITSDGITTSIFPATDATLNIALANGTCTGITAAASSANTNAGTATSGVLIYDGDGRDFEGVTLASLTTINAELFKTIGSNFVVDGSGDDLFSIFANGSYLFAPGLNETTYTFTSSAAGALQITVVGQD